MKILIIEDDQEVSDFLKHSFINEGHNVDIADNGVDGSYRARINYYDVVIIDYSLPKKNGLVICNEIRNSGSNSAILFLSTTHDTNLKVECLEAGADDYMTKPFAFEELRARLNALMRRPKQIEQSIVVVDDLTVDLKKQVAQRGSNVIHLTKTEYSLLEYLVRNRGMVLSRGMIMEHVWSAQSDPLSNTIEAHLANLRRKLNTRGKPDLIRNVVGRGYIIDA